MIDSFYEMQGKRYFDLCFAFLSLLILFPVMLFVSFLLYYYEGHPIIFIQMRHGLGGEPFKLYKFRTMRNIHDAHNKLLADKYRISSIGRVLREFSLDELPQLINVLKGEMSIVGPRPLPDKYTPRYSHQQARRLETRPGITGWSQINGRNLITWEKKFKLDVWYVDNLSFKLDILIIILTIKAVIAKKGINQNKNATMEEFMGNTKLVDSKKVV